MGARVFLLVVGLATLGCGQSSRKEPSPPESSDPGPITDLPFALSGERLHAWWFAGHTQEVFVTFHDQELDVDCTFAPSQTSARRVCFPTQQVGVAYLDEACREPVASVDALLTLARGASVSSVVPNPKDECDDDPAPFRVGYQVGELLRDGSVDTIDT